MDTHSKSYGYYYVSLGAPLKRKFLLSNNERAFVISQFQDLLSPRLLIGTAPPYMQLASCIDLLAFSITAESIQLVLFSIDPSTITQLTRHIALRLSQYQYEYRPQDTNPEKPSAVFKKLRGPHEALSKSVELHSRHEDWEYDRYSSIGFYLHDRRGDWMRIWRLAQLYSADTSNYRLLIENYIGQRTTYAIMPTNRLFAS